MVYFKTRNTERMRIDKDGNVGIGTTGPFAKLVIGSSASGSSDIDTLGFRSINNSAQQRDGYKQRIGFYGKEEYSNSERLSAAIDCIYGDNVHIPTYPGTSSTNLAFTIHDRSGSLYEAMRIAHNGNVGIGTENPGGLLHICSGTSGDCHLILQSDTDNNNETDNPKIVFRQDGALNTAEIGIENSGNKLALRGTSGIAFYDGGTSSSDIDNIEDTSTELMRILADGNVGIGVTSADYKLDVDGDINIASGKKFRIDGTALTNSATITADTSNVASTIVLRDSNGNFSAGTITANLNGNADTASSCSGNAATATAAETANTAVNSDTVDDLHASSFLRSDQSTTCSGKLTVTGYSYDSVSAITDRYFIAKKDLHANWSLGEDDFPSYDTSIRASYYISGDGLLATSDERAKMEIQTLDTEMALSKLDKIRPVSYKMKHTGQFTFGFIGQEIEKELPNVVNKDMGYISDFNIMGVFSNKQSTKYQGKDEEKDAFVYTLTLDVPIPSTFDVNLSTYIETACVSEGITAEFFYDPEYCGKPEIGGTVMKLLSEKDNVREGVSYKIIGTLVNDFRSLDYNEIFTVTTAALKEVNEQLKAEKIKTADLTARVEDLEAMVSIIKLNMTWPDA
jgi:hypothetical protein